MKSSIEQLAIFGGTPGWDKALHVGRPNIGDRDRLFSRIGSALDRQWLSNDGPLVREFEARLAERLGVKHCIATCNGTIGLMLAARALNLTGEVIVPSFTFAATAHALAWSGITPVFADIDPASACIDPSEVDALVTSRTTGIVGVHVWGRPCNIDGLVEVARRRHLHLLFDAAHALGCSYNGTMIGGFGDAEVFSFHATKIVNSFEGGAIATNDAGLAGRLDRLRNFGFSDWDLVDEVGINGKMHEASAAMGLTSLESLSSLIEVNRQRYRRYVDQLQSIEGISVIRYDESERANYHYLVIEVDESRRGLSRDGLQLVLHAENVLARRYFYPGCHAMSPYRGAPTRRPLPETERLSACVLSLPNGPSISEMDVDAACAVIRLAMDNGPLVADRLLAAR